MALSLILDVNALKQMITTKKTLRSVRMPKSQQFSSIRLRGQVLAIGDAVKVRIKPDEVGLATVVAILLTHAKKVKIKVRWYYSPAEVGIQASFLSQGEVFDSKKTALIPLESLIEKAEVLTLEEYNTLDFADDCTYFCRATLFGKTLYPPFSEWELMCTCQQIINPDKAMILCEVCWLYFHTECIGLPFVCPNCSN